MSESIEQWAPIPGFPGYEASTAGRVRRGTRLKKSQIGRGYPQVGLTRNGKNKSVYVHCLVTAAFLGPRPPRHDVNHKNACRTDNRLENLEYVTRRENVHHAVRLGRHPKGERHGQSKLTWEQVSEIRRLAGIETQKSLAARFGVHDRHISEIVRGVLWKVQGPDETAPRAANGG